MSPLFDEMVRSPADEEVWRARADIFLQGFAVLPGLLSDDLLTTVHGELKRLSSAAARSAGQSLWCLDANGDPLSAHGLERSSELVYDLVRLGPLIGLAESILGGRCVPFLTEFFGKPGCGATPSPAHQDQQFYKNHFTDEIALTFWCPLDDVGVDDAPLEYAVPNASPGQLLPHVPSAVENFGSELPQAERFRFQPVPLRRGDIVAHHAYTIHRSGSNVSGRYRQAIALSYRTSAFRNWPRR